MEVVDSHVFPLPETLPPPLRDNYASSAQGQGSGHGKPVLRRTGASGRGSFECMHNNNQQGCRVGANIAIVNMCVIGDGAAFKLDRRLSRIVTTTPPRPSWLLSWLLLVPLLLPLLVCCVTKPHLSVYLWYLFRD